jgi:DHA1 family multidrug resistance protein-like MFS transporter
LGGALFDAPSSAAIAALTNEANRSRFYSLLGISSGLGMTIGPLAGALLLKTNFTLVAFVAAACFFVAFWIILLLLPSVQVASGTHGLTDGIVMALRDRRFMLFNLMLMGYWFMWVQITISLPLVARAISGTSDAVSWVYALNAGMGIVLQYPLLWLAERRLQPLQILILGIVIMACGLASIALANNTMTLLLCVALFAVGRLLASPAQQTVAASMANPDAFGSYFGVSALALAVGGGIGNTSGGILYGLGHDIHAPMLPWLLFGAAGLICAIGLSLMSRNQQRAEQPKPVVVG